MDLTYFSLDNGIENRDTVQCRPQFHRRQRIDTVLVETPGVGYRPARLHLIFEAVAYKKLWQVARITYFQPLLESEMDKIIGMARYKESTTGDFVLLNRITRSCYMVPFFSSSGYFYLNNLAAGCTDLYLRCGL